eukprot:scaffold7269_cov68-Cyclotella_meneghiniana.AAC.1
MSRVLYCLSSQSPRIMAAFIGSVEILWGMLTADRPEKRRQATRGSQPAAVVPTWCRGGKARGGGGGDEGRRRLGAEGVVVDVAIMVVDELLRCWFWVDYCWWLGCLLVLANPQSKSAPKSEKEYLGFSAYLEVILFPIRKKQNLFRTIRKKQWITLIGSRNRLPNRIKKGLTERVDASHSSWTVPMSHISNFIAELWTIGPVDASHHNSWTVPMSHFK